MNQYVLTTEITGLKPILGVFDDVEKAKAYLSEKGLFWSRQDMLTGATYSMDASGNYGGYTIELVELNPERNR